MGLLDLITGGKTSEASRNMEAALRDIQGVKAPTAEDLQFQIQQLVQAGVLTPEQAKTFLQNPNALQGMNIDQTGTGAEKTAIADLLGAAEQGGLNPQEQEQIAEINRLTGTQEKGANDAVLQNTAARGTLTGGETLAAQLLNNQNATTNANDAAGKTAATAYEQMLNELTTAGTMGSGLQGQENTQANTVGAATNAINQFNTAQQQQEENLNTGTQNEAEKFNLENKQNIENQNIANENTHAEKMANTKQQAYEDQIQKAAAEAGVSENTANLNTQQGGQEAGLIGGFVGAGGEVASAGLTKAPVIAKMSDGGEIQSYLNGGSVPGKASVPGNSPKNDTVPAMLSPGEVVLPRTVAHSKPDQVMEFLNRIRQKKEPAPAHPHDVKSVLDALSLRRSA